MKNKRKHPTIDLMKLYSFGSHNGWNEFLDKCILNMDINALARARYGVQAGMSDLAEANLNTDEINVWFARLIKSIDATAKCIVRKRHPLKTDNPLFRLTASLDEIAAKKKRDQELRAFLYEGSF